MKDRIKEEFKKKYIKEKVEEYKKRIADEAEQKAQEYVKKMDESETNISKNMTEELKNNTLIVRNKENLTKSFYGPNNFMQEGAQKWCFKDHKKLFDLLLKCDGKKYKKLLDEKDENVKANHKNILSVLAMASTEAFGKNNKYNKKASELLQAINS